MSNPALSLPPVSELFDAFVPDPGDADRGDAGLRATALDAVAVDGIIFDLPVELDVARGDDATVTAVGMSPPTQMIATTVMPVFHRLRLTIVGSERW